MAIRILYNGQLAGMRRFAIGKIPNEHPGFLTDTDIKNILEGLGYVALSENDEIVLLIKQTDIDGLVEKGEAAWLTR